MVESIMFFGIGFLAASLLGLVFIPLVHGRAVRLTLRRLEAATPISMAEIQADKDQLRAEFAMSTRRLELTVEQLMAKTTSQLAELGKKSDAINRLKAELDEKSEAVAGLEANEKALTDHLQAIEGEYSLKHSGMREAERNLADRESALDKLAHELTDRSLTSDSQRVEIAALRTQIDTLKAQLEDYERLMKDTRLDHTRGEAEGATAMLAGERGPTVDRSNKVAELERQLLAHSADADLIARHVQDLEARLAEQARLLAAREHEAAQLRAALQAASKVERDLRAEVATFDQRLAATTESLRADKAQAETKAEQAREERFRAQRELAVLQKEAEANWAEERLEAALLRDRLNDVAAEVARLTLALEGPNSPIETLLAADAAQANGGHREGNGRRDPAGAGGGGGGSAAAIGGGASLADRIRALQSRAARLTRTS
jgi:chromosome segregation ATPase